GGHRAIRRDDRPTASGVEHGHAFFWQVAKHERGLLRRWLSAGWGWLSSGSDFRLAQHCEPIRKLGVAAVVAVRRFLVLAAGHPRRAFEPDVKMIIVPPPRSYFSEPGPVLTRLLAQHLLDRRMHEDAADLRIGRCTLDQLG